MNKDLAGRLAEVRQPVETQASRERDALQAVAIMKDATRWGEQARQNMTRRPIVAAVLAGGLIALASACAAPQVGQPAFAKRPCREYTMPASSSPGGNPLGITIMANGAAHVTIMFASSTPCDLQGSERDQYGAVTRYTDRLDLVVPLASYGGSVNAAAVECQDAGGAARVPVSDDATEVVCERAEF